MARGCFDVRNGSRLILPFNEKKYGTKHRKTVQEKVRNLKYWADAVDL